MGVKEFGTQHSAEQDLGFIPKHKLQQISMISFFHEHLAHVGCAGSRS